MIVIPDDVRGLTLYRTRDGWQASVTLDGSAWRVVRKQDPIAAIMEALTTPVEKLDFLA